MLDEYDFSEAKRGPVVSTPGNKTRITIRIDTDVLDWFREQVNATSGGSYQAFVNQVLREYIDGRAQQVGIAIPSRSARGNTPSTKG